MTSPIAITGTAANQPAIDLGSVSPFGSVQITDSDSPANETVTVTLLNPTEGSLTNLAATATYDPGTGIYTDSGSLATVNADLQSLQFTPVPGLNAATTFTFTITDTNGTDTAAPDSNTSVIVTPVGPGITGTVSGQTATGLPPWEWRVC